MKSKKQHRHQRIEQQEMVTPSEPSPSTPAVPDGDAASANCLRGVLALHWPIAVVILCAMLAGLLVYGDYGVAWDEPAQRMTGLVNAQAFGGNRALLEQYPDKDYGPLVEVLLHPLERLGDERLVYRARHLATHFFHLAAAAALYTLLMMQCRGWVVPLVGVCLFLLSPHIYVHSFVNTKDIPAMNLWVFNLLALRLLLRRPGWVLALIAGVLLACLANVRLVGLALLPFFCVALFLGAQGQIPLRQRLGMGVAFVATAALVLYATWPHLWSSPFENFLGALRSMSAFRWDGYVLFAGKVWEAHELPFRYLPVWLWASVPSVTLLLAAVGSVTVLAAHWWRKESSLRDPNRLFEYAIVAILLVALAGAVLLRPVIYDGWRHFFFLFPFIVLTAAFGLRDLLSLFAQRPLATGALWGVVVLSLLNTLSWMVTAHPHQQMYWKAPLRSTHVPRWQAYDGDYWGMSMKQGLEAALQLADGQPITVSGWPAEVLEINHVMLPKADREKIRLVSPEEPHTYFITCWRGITEPFGPATQVYRVVVDDSEVVSVFRR